MKNILITTCISIIMFCSSCLGINELFEIYKIDIKLGDPIQEVKKAYNILEIYRNNKSIVYEININQISDVELERFNLSFIDGYLNEVLIYLQGRENFDKFKELLERVYGSGFQRNKNIEIYSWGNINKKVTIEYELNRISEKSVLISKLKSEVSNLVKTDNIDIKEVEQNKKNVEYDINKLQTRYAHGTINIRRGRGTKYEVIGKLYKGDLVKIDSLKDNWVVVYKYGIRQGYVYEKLLFDNLYKNKENDNIVFENKPTKKNIAFDSERIKINKRIQFAKDLNDALYPEAKITIRGDDYKTLKYETMVMDKNYARMLYLTLLEDDVFMSLGFEYLEFTDGEEFEVAYILF